MINRKVIIFLNQTLALQEEVNEVINNITRKLIITFEPEKEKEVEMKKK